MSKKINILYIVKGHLGTLINAESKKVSIADMVTFFVLPLSICILAISFNFKLNDGLTSLLVNFGAIFTALLLSVLVLVYDQSTKLEDRNKNTKETFYPIKKKLLQELYFNISYSIILSLGLVFFSFLESIARGGTSSSFMSIYLNRFILMPIVIFISLHICLTIMMIIKRLHILLTSD